MALDTITPLEEFRVSTLEELGFSLPEATQLANTFRTVRMRIGQVPRRFEQRVDHHYVKELLDAGATHTQILRILL